MTPSRIGMCLSLLMLLPALALAHGKPHQHGAVSLDIAIEADQVVVMLTSPLDNLVGFERAPRTAAERKQVQDAVARLRAAEQWLVLDSAAACRLLDAAVESDALPSGAAPSAGAARGHADLDATLRFACQDAARARFVDTALFEAFPRVSRLDVQIATSRGQTRQTLKRPATRIHLPR